jgi:hypothetical protein
VNERNVGAVVIAGWLLEIDGCLGMESLLPGSWTALIAASVWQAEWTDTP